jgi:hypothetical protein
MFVLLILMSFFNVFACDLSNSVRHVNPDGSLGGWVEFSARVASTAHIGANAKVCSGSRVDGNAIIDGKAILSGKSWVSGNVKVLDDSTVYGNAQIVSSGEEIVISGKSKIFGHSRIRGASRITGSSQVSGGMDLENVVTSGQAKLCLNYHLKDRIINDDFHCLKTSETEVALSLQNYSENKINIKSKDVVFKLKDTAFSIQPNAIKVILNQSMLSDQVVVRRGLISFPSDALVTGKNTILVIGQDYNRRKIISKEFQVYVAENKNLIELGVGNEFDDALVKIIYYQEDDGFEAIGKVINGVLEIDSPNHDDFTHVRILAASSKFVLYKEIDLNSSTEFPEELALLPLSASSDELADFSASMEGWTVSDPSRVVYKDDGSRSIALVSSKDSDLLISKVVSLPKHIKQLAFKINPLEPVKEGEINSKLEILIVPLEEKSFKNYEIQDVSIDIFDEYTTTAFKESAKVERYIVLFKLNKTGVELKKTSEEDEEDEEVYLIFRGIMTTPQVTFRAFNLGVTNSDNNPSIPNLSDVFLFGPNCARDNFEIIKATIERQDLHFISANYSSTINDNSMNIIQKNRIWGEVLFHAIPYSGTPPDIEFRLKKTRNGVPVAVSKVTSCIVQDVLSSSGLFLANYRYQQNLVAPLMEFNFSDYSQAAFEANEKIFLELYIPAYGILGETIITTPYEMLVPLKINEKHYNAKKIDHYDQRKSPYVMTGGDKWIRPGYQDAFFDSLTKSYSTIWQVNDLSMLNGGHYGHTTHNLGLDGDYSYGTYNFADFKDRTEWSESLRKIEDFISKIDYTYLRDIAIEYLNDKYEPFYIVSKFQNRCMVSCGDKLKCKSRYINLDKKAGQKSLMRNVPKHRDHLHVRFNHPEDGSPKENESNDDLDENFISKLNMTINVSASSETFSVSTKPYLGTNPFINKTVYWRYQDSWGFDDFYMRLCAGDTSSLAYQDDSMIRCGSPMANSNIRYIYLMLVDNSTGECVVATDGLDDFIRINIEDTDSLANYGIAIKTGIRKNP